jgi:hypothetical protein
MCNSCVSMIASIPAFVPIASAAMNVRHPLSPMFDAMPRSLRAARLRLFGRKGLPAFPLSVAGSVSPVAASEQFA